MPQDNASAAVLFLAKVVYTENLASLLTFLETNETPPLTKEKYRKLWEKRTEKLVDGQAIDQTEADLDSLLVSAVGEYAASRWETDIPDEYRMGDVLDVYYDTFDDLLEKVKEQHIKFYDKHLHIFRVAAVMAPTVGLPPLTVMLYVKMWEEYARPKVNCYPEHINDVFISGLKLHAFNNFERDIAESDRA